MSLSIRPAHALILNASPFFYHQQDTSVNLPQSANADTTVTDTGSQPTKKKKSFIDAQVKYSAEDSTVLSRDHKRVYLYKNAHIEYGAITLDADYIEYDQENNEVYATGLKDSTGNLAGLPIFKEGSERFEAKTIKYNFQTRKGYIEEVFTEEEDGYLHSQITKKVGDKEFLNKNGKYTTCDDPDPHYYLMMTRSKMIPGDKIVSGYSYIVIEGLPIYFAGLPFGYFPSKNEQSSGILIPTYGEESNRGFYLRNGGYYFGINDYMDLSLTGDVYSKGTWGTNLTYRFRKRYKFTSNFSAKYYQNVLGDKGTDDYSKSTDYSIIWRHTQDAKANPTSKFSASVNFSSSSYDKLHSNNMNNYVNNTKSSSISYSKNWPGSPFRFSADLKHTQNSKTNSVNLKLPIMTFNMSRQYPFRRKNRSGDMKWYENIEVSYSSKFENRLNTVDSLLFSDTQYEDFEYGFQHRIPLRTNIKTLKYLNISPQIEYTGILYPNRVNKYLDETSFIDNETGEIIPTVVTDTISGFKYAQVVEPSLSMSMAPKVYGMYQFVNESSKVQAIRHVMTPSVSFNFRPDLGTMVEKYYDNYETPEGRQREYSIYSNGIYSVPSTPGKNGSFSFGWKHNVEMKVLSKDTANPVKKVKLLDYLNFTSSYDVYKDSLNWSPIRVSMRTSLFKNALRLNVNGRLDPYYITDDGQLRDRFMWEESAGVFRLTSFDVSVDLKLNSKEGDEGEGSGGNTESMMGGSMMDPADKFYREDIMSSYVDFEVPWNLSLRYKFSYSKPAHESTIRQTLSFSGNVSLTKKWKISVNSNYDFEEGKLAATSINIHRDLHCWEMSFGWVPVGYRQSYNFRINVKASVLQDLQLTKRRSWYDNL